MMKILLSGKKGFYFPEIFLYSLDGGITKNRQLCIDEVTQVLYECYGENYGLSIDECKNIYLRKITPKLYSKILSNITNKKILDSLTYCYEVVQTSENSLEKNVN